MSCRHPLTLWPFCFARLRKKCVAGKRDRVHDLLAWRQHHHTTSAGRPKIRLENLLRGSPYARLHPVPGKTDHDGDLSRRLYRRATAGRCRLPRQSNTNQRLQADTAGCTVAQCAWRVQVAGLAKLFGHIPDELMAEDQVFPHQFIQSVPENHSVVMILQAVRPECCVNAPHCGNHMASNRSGLAAGLRAQAAHGVSTEQRKSRMQNVTCDAEQPKNLQQQHLAVRTRLSRCCRASIYW